MEGDNVNMIMKREKAGLREPAWPVSALLLFSVSRHVLHAEPGSLCRQWA